MEINVIGQSSNAEFQPLVTWWKSRARVKSFLRLQDRLDTFCSADECDLTLLLESRPHEFGRTEMLQLRSLQPLTPILNVYGSWCESDSRTGIPPAAVMRLHWSHAVPRCAADWDRLRRGLCPFWSMPWTMTDEDRDGQDVPLPALPGPLVIAVISSSSDMADAIIRMVAEWGATPYRAAASTPSLQIGTQLLIHDDLAGVRDVRINGPDARSVAPTLPILALADFPRAGQWGAAPPTNGREMLLAKPFRAEDLYWAIRLLTSPQPADESTNPLAKTTRSW